MNHIDEHSLKKILIALAVYITSLLASNTLGLKIMPFLFGSHLSVGVFSFPVVFLMTDAIGEVHGERVAKLFVLAGFVSTALFIVYSLISLWAPWSPDGLWARTGYNQIFGISTRTAVASLLAFLIAEYEDVRSFFFFREKIGKQLFWISSNLSNFWSQFIDTIIFMIVAFWGVYRPAVIFSMIITWWLYKVAMGIFYTPLSYLGLKMLKQSA